MEELDKNRSQYDTTLKVLFEQPPQRLLQVLLGRQAVAALPVEFASTQKRVPDLVFLMDDDSISHIELNSRSEGMAWRMLLYYSLIRQKYPTRTLVQKVLYVGEQRWRESAGIAEPDLSFRYQVVDIRDIDCQVLMASPLLEENILAVLCGMADQDETIREILYRISKLPDKARADALAKLLILSRLRRLEVVIKKEAEEMALTFNVMENDVLRPMFLQAQMDGKQEGRQEGRQEGKQEGKADTLTRQLQRRFGPLPQWAADKIATANLATLEEWSLRILDAPSLESVLVEPS
jgi:predicted transposase YdaD